jgi:RNA polymerase-binding transcription factor DksA
MTVSEMTWPGLTVHEQSSLRDALAHRRKSLHAALGLYEDAAIPTPPRMALARRSRAAIADIDLAFDRMEDPKYGSCEHCHERLTVQTLTLRPLETRCPGCDLLEASRPVGRPRGGTRPGRKGVRA